MLTNFLRHKCVVWVCVCGCMCACVCGVCVCCVGGRCANVWMTGLLLANASATLIFRSSKQCSRKCLRISKQWKHVHDKGLFDWNWLRAINPGLWHFYFTYWKFQSIGSIFLHHKTLAGSRHPTEALFALSLATHGHASPASLPECHESSLVASCSFYSWAAEMWGVTMGG